MGELNSLKASVRDGALRTNGLATLARSVAQETEINIGMSSSFDEMQKAFIKEKKKSATLLDQSNDMRAALETERRFCDEAVSNIDKLRQDLKDRDATIAHLHSRDYRRGPFASATVADLDDLERSPGYVVLREQLGRGFVRLYKRQYPHVDMQ